MARHGEYQHENIGRSGRSHHCTHVWYVAKTVQLWYHLYHFKIYYLMKQYICTSSCWRCSQDCLREQKLMLLPLPCILVEKQRWYWRGSIVSSCQLSLLQPTSLVRLTVLVGRFMVVFLLPFGFIPIVYFVVVFYEGFTLIQVRFLVLASLLRERAIYGRKRGQM